jgi:serine phosphatase RsbU (regulator of sigma subunit)
MLMRDTLNPQHCRTLASSPAFRAASLRSEIQRAYAVIGVAVLAAGLIFLHTGNERMNQQIRVIGSAGLGALAVLQVGVIAFARWARRAGCGIPFWFVVITVIIESLIPSGMIMANIMGGFLPAYSALTTPPILAYGILIGLTTLRLRPVLCILAGIVSAAGYVGMLAYVVYVLGITEPTTGVPQLTYFNSAVLLFISGLAAAWVARELRGHMEAALDEAEMRRQMDRIEHDLVAAQTIQQALLPHAAPTIAGFDIAGWNRPADQTGGDYYDWQMLPDGNWIITVADVSGHGIGPALVTAACRAYVRASGEHRGDLPALTGRINRLLADDLPGGRFVTMVSVLINPRTQPIALLSAGHGPMVLYVSSTGKVQDILPGDLPLAIEPDTTFGPPQLITMGQGDVLALITDGFVEWAKRDAHGDREEFGIERLRESLGRHAKLPASQMIEAITADVSAFTNPTPQQDDLTIVVIRRVG